MATDPRQRLAEFADYLREHGFSPGYAEIELMTRIAAMVPLTGFGRLGPMWRAIVSRNRTLWGKYAGLHEAFWFPNRTKGATRSSGLTRRGRTLPELVQQMHGDGDNAATATQSARLPLFGEGYDADAEGYRPEAQGGASRAEALERRDFADWSPEDIDRFEPLVEAFQRRIRAKLLRRFAPANESHRIDLRRSLRAAMSTDGELVALRHLRRRRHQPRTVLLVDVSRSMETHAHFYLRLARAFVKVANARAFVFHTRLAEVTDLLKRRSSRVQEKINTVTSGFGGGTRIASCVALALQEHLTRRLDRGDMVLIFSDGYDTDDPGELAKVLGQLRLRGARVFWLHPTKQPPVSAALVLARQEVTRFMPVYNLATLARLPTLLY